MLKRWVENFAHLTDEPRREPAVRADNYPLLRPSKLKGSDKCPD